RLVMIREFDIRRRDNTILVGIALDHAVLDFETTEAILRKCLAFLDTPHKGLVDIRIGKFGQFPVRLNMHHDDHCQSLWTVRRLILRVSLARPSGYPKRICALS